MLHIINKIYINVGNEIDLDNFSYIVSDNNYLLNEMPPKVLKHARNFNKLVQDFSSESELFTALLGKNDRLNIYLSQNEYILFLIKWLKTLCPFITERAACQFFDLHQNFSTGIKKVYPREFAGYFRRVEAFSLTAEQMKLVKENCSIEFQWINYILDSKNLTAGTFEEKIQSFYQSKLVNEICFLKAEFGPKLYLLENILEEGKLEVSTDTSLGTLFVNFPELEFLIDPKITSGVSYGYLEDTYSLSGITSTLVNLWSKVSEVLSSDDEKAIDFSKEASGTPTCTRVLELENYDDLQFPEVFNANNRAREGKINLYLLQQIEHAKNISNTEWLRNFRFE